MKNKNTVSVDISELESYVRSTTDKSPPDTTGWVTVKLACLVLSVDMVSETEPI